MFGKSMARTEMMGLWKILFDSCNEDYFCVLGWILVGIVGLLAVVIGLRVMIARLNKRE
jgi:hypothetical protein